MANCYFCQKKIGLLESGYDLDTERFPQKICYVCDTKRRVLRSFAKGDYAEAYDFFVKQQERTDLDLIAKEIITFWIQDGKERQIKKNAEEREQEVLTNILTNFPMTTGYNFEGYRITEYRGVVSSATVLGTGFLSDVSAIVSDAFGTESNALETKIISARNSAKEKLVRKAHEIGGTGLIGIDYDLSVLAGNAIAILATGTAVVVERITYTAGNTLQEIEANLPEI